MRVRSVVLLTALLVPVSLAVAQDDHPKPVSDEDRKLDEALRGAPGDEPPPPPPTTPPPVRDEKEEDKDRTQLRLYALVAHWSARVYKARFVTSQDVARGSEGVDDGQSSFVDSTEGGASTTGHHIETQNYKAFVGVHFTTGIDLGLEGGGRRLVLRSGAPAPVGVDFSGQTWSPGEPIDTLLEYSSVDLDWAFDTTFPHKWLRLEIRAGFSYLEARTRLRGVLTGTTAGYSLEAICPMWGIGVAVRPVHMKVFAVEIYARARGGGWGGRTVVGLGQTELGLSVIFLETVGITIGHRLESATFDRSPQIGDAVLVRGQIVTHESVRFAAEGAFFAAFAEF